METENLISGLLREKGEVGMTDEMARRAGIPHATGRVILSMARICLRKAGKSMNMILVAEAIKYAGDNKHLLK